MFRGSEIIGYGISATDGSIGTVADLLFDDAHWGIRWAVIDTGTWLPGRRVLLPPHELRRPDALTREFSIEFPSEHVKDAPGLEADAPVSRQLEASIFGYYGWTPYWDATYGYPMGPGAVGGFAVPTPPAGVAETGGGTAPEPLDEARGDPHLRSVNEVTGYYVQASDGDIGHIEDFMVDEDAWAVRYLMIDTKNWWPGRMVLISPRWLRDISWSDRQVFLDVTRDAVKGSPEFDPATTPDRAYEERLHGYYGIEPYWV